MKQELFDNQATVSHSLTQLSYTAREQRIPMQNRCSESKFVRKPCSLLLAFVGINLRRIARRGVIPRQEILHYAHASFRMTLRRKSFNTLQGILPPCGRQNDSATERKRTKNCEKKVFTEFS